MKKIYALFAFLSIVVMANAVPADPTPFLYTLEDGTQVLAVLHGDEFYSYITDLEGNLLEGTIPSENEALSIRRAHRIQQSVQAGTGFPLTGSPKSVAILVNFSDVKFQYTREDFVDLLNKSGYDRNGSTGSCRDYFIACSDSLFTPQFDVWGPFTVSGTMAKYGAQKGDDHDTDPGSAFIEACQLAREAGVDFSQYDTDGDGVIDNVFFYYAGNNQAEGGPANSIWPHQSNLSGRNVTLDGKLLASYACTSELRGTGKTMCNIGTFCHEFGHVLGLPDFYDTQNSSHYTVGAWDIMAGGNYNNEGRTPPTYSGYERFYLGWRTPIQLQQPGRYEMAPLADGGDIYLIADGVHNLSPKNSSPSEFFMLEYRERVGWEEPRGALTGTGILIWHIDYSAKEWGGNTVNNNAVLRYHLEEAGGNRGRESATDPYPGSSNVTSFTPKLHNGTVLTTQPVYDITTSGSTAGFVYISKGEQHLHAYPAALDVTTTIGSDGKAKEWSAAAIHLVGEKLSQNEVFAMSVPTKSSFMLTLDKAATTSRTSTKWKRSLSLSGAVDSEGRLDTTIYVNFNAQHVSCETEAVTLTIKSDSNLLTIPLTGSAPRHTYVVTPKLKATSEVTPYSFVASWKPVTDAEEYYITVYQAEQGRTEITQDFENFDKATAITNQGWSSNFVATTTSWKKDGVSSLMFKNNGNQVVTEEYQAALCEISFYLNAFTTDVDTIGELVVEGTADNTTWTPIDTLRIPARTKAKLFKLTIDPTLGLKKVRFTYWDLGGNGLAMDQFTAAMSEKITYVYRGRELAISAYGNNPTSKAVGGLQPNSTYYYQIQCTDLDKGCEEHMTDLSNPVKVVTLEGEDADGRKLTMAIDEINFDEPTHTVYVPNPVQGEYLYVFDHMGHAVYTIPVSADVYYYEIPVERFVSNIVYTIKYTGERMKRKTPAVKFVVM